MKSKIVVLLFFVFAVLHQDLWNWDNRSLWFGFLPVGLGYHVLYSITAGVFWYLVSSFAWPTETEAWADLPAED
jgi:hypothetical protein